MDSSSVLIFQHPKWFIRLYNPSNLFARHVTEYSPAKTGEYPRIFPNFENCARCEKDLKDNKDDSLHLGRKYARIFVLGHYLFLEAHSFPRATLSENCSLLGTDNVRGQISEHEGPQLGSQIPLSRPFFPVNPVIPPFFTCKSRSRPLFKDVFALVINLLNNNINAETLQK